MRDTTDRGQKSGQNLQCLPAFSGRSDQTQSSAITAQVSASVAGMLFQVQLKQISSSNYFLPLQYSSGKQKKYAVHVKFTCGAKVGLNTALEVLCR